MRRQFNGKRLKEALQFRGKRLSDLADEIGISKQSLSLYANGDNIPPYDNVAKIALSLAFPVDFFMTEDTCNVTTYNTYFRSQMSAKKLDQNAQKVKMEYVAKIYEALLRYVDVPKLNIPDVSFEDSDNILKVDSDEQLSRIEIIAMGLRHHWKLGDGPIENLQYILESNGIVVTGFKDVDDRIDAFSQRIHIENQGVVFTVALGIGSKPDCRLKFDMAHELGHILLHDWDDGNECLNKDEFAALEKQANMFASAFLMPRASFGRDVIPYANKVEYYRALKAKWGVSIQAMMYRARQLDIITANQFQYMMRTVSSNGWRIREPGDTPGKLNATIFQGALDVLFESNYSSPDSFIKDLYDQGICLSQRDLEDILGLKEGTLNVNTKKEKLAKLKIEQSRTETNVE